MKMVEQKRSFHKKRKWICKKCGAVRMQELKSDRSRRSGDSARG